MKKLCTALALSGLACAAYAQSSLTIFGVVDASITHGQGSGPGSTRRTQLHNSQWQSSRLGFRGVEDLGDGMSASFWLEAGVSNDDGRGFSTNTNNQPSGGAAPGLNGSQGLSFNRRSTVSLAGRWGEVRLGRDYTAHFWNLVIFDPFGASGVGTNQTLVSGLGGVTAVRASNVVGYFLPANLGGFYGQVQHYMGENAHNGAATQNDGNGTSLRAGWRNGPVNVALAWGKTRYASGDVEIANVGGEYNFGVARVQATLSSDKVSSAVPVRGHGGLLGLIVPIGANELRASYARYRTDAAGHPASSKLTVGLIHNLSVRTALYAIAARVSNSGGASQAVGFATTAPNHGSFGYDVGLKHSF